MANGFLEPVCLPLQGRGLRPSAAVMLAAALAAVALSALAPGVKVLAAAFVVLVAGVEWRRWRVGRGSHQVARAWLGADQRWRISTEPGIWMEAELVRCWGVTRGPVMALQWALGDGGVCRAWLPKSAVSARVWRRLRVRLRLH